MPNIRLVDLSRQHKRLKKEINSAIARVLASSHFILGEEVEKFEEEFAHFCGAKYCVGLDNGSSALELGLRALGIGPGDEVITPVNSFIASSSAISFAGATPVWVDCDPQTYNIDVTQIERAITKKTRALMPVHLCGQPAAMDKILTLAKKYKLLVVEDACQAHGATFVGKPIGSLGIWAAFSFYPGKNLGALGDAGALVTNNKIVADKVRMMHNYGQVDKYHHKVLAWNRRLDGLQAAILRVKLKHLRHWNELRRSHAKLYNHLLAKLPVVCPYEYPRGTHIYHLYVIRTKKRDALRKFLTSRGIETGIHYPIPIHKQRAYRPIRSSRRYPVAERLAKESLSLPMFPELSEKEVRYVCQTIRQFFARS